MWVLTFGAILGQRKTRLPRHEILAIITNSVIACQVGRQAGVRAYDAKKIQMRKQLGIKWGLLVEINICQCIGQQGRSIERQNTNQCSFKHREIPAVKSVSSKPIGRCDSKYVGI